jgi:hypothetical protein
MMHINDIADRTEKVLYLSMDLALNSAFLHKVRRELIAEGLTKYKLLFNFNVSAVVVSLSMDVGTVRVPNIMPCRADCIADLNHSHDVITEPFPLCHFSSSCL